MLRKFYLISSLCLSWIIFANIPNNLITKIFFFSCILITYIITKYLDLIPKYSILGLSLFSYLIGLIKDIFLSGFMVTKIIWQKKINIDDEIIEIKINYPLETSLVMIANSITLTPGTATIDINEKTLFVHALNKKIADDLKKEDFEKKISFLIKNKLK